MGVSFVTNRIDCAASGDMRIVELEDPAPSLTVALAWRKDDPSPLLGTLRDLALEGAAA